MIKEAIRMLADGVDLSETEMIEVMHEIMGGEATPAQIASFITALRIKGETVAEITGAARVMREKATLISPDLSRQAGRLVDTCGTGGDLSHTFNISTTAAFVVAGAKHGNRSVSSRSGSADLLEALGVNIETSPARVAECLEEIGIGFLFAPTFHGAMKHAIGPRKEIGIRTVFNLLGPLTNPLSATAQVVGVYDSELTGTVAKVLANLGVVRAFVVHGEDGLDEITVTDRSKISELRDGRVYDYYIVPEDFGIERGSVLDLEGGDAATNARLTLDILHGAVGPRRNIVLFNAAAGIVAGGLTESFGEAVGIAEKSIDSGAAMAKLEQLRQVTNR